MFYENVFFWIATIFYILLLILDFIFFMKIPRHIRKSNKKIRYLIIFSIFHYYKHSEYKEN